jgi:Rod binding domain-containing protein
MTSHDIITASQSRVSQKTPEEQLARLKQMKKACADLESLFTNTLMKAMRESGGYMPQTPGGDVYLSMAEQQVSQSLAQGRGMGLGRTMFQQMLSREDPNGVAAQDKELAALAAGRRISPEQVSHPGLPRTGNQTPEICSGGDPS